MTKGQFIAYCKLLGVRCGFSGKAGVMYVYPSHVENVELLAVQHFGIISDFKIVQLP